MEKFKKHTKLIGLWCVGDTQYFRTPAINISELKKYKGTIRIVFTQNKYYAGGKNQRPKYLCSIVESTATETEEDIEDLFSPYKDGERYYTEDGERLYTRDEVRRVISGTVDDVHYGFHDPGDILIEDFVL